MQALGLLNNINGLADSALELLGRLISTPSFSREESGTASIIKEFLIGQGCASFRISNNIVSLCKAHDRSKPSLILNSHHDTVKPNSGYTLDPFHPMTMDSKLYGLGSNDAGGCLVSLIAAYIALYSEELPFNLVLIASAEEEISGPNGIQLVLNHPDFLHKVTPHPDDFAIVGEPTNMQMAIAERGLMVIDGVARGVAGHAARSEGVNALSIALTDLKVIENIHFEQVSDLLGPVKVTPTVIHTENKAHNVVPDSCQFVLDCRVNEQYTLNEVLEYLQAHCKSTLTPRSMRLKPTMIGFDHPLVVAGINMGKSQYGSPTLSDKALMHCPSLKIGPGDSKRSHTADEYIYIDEIRKAIPDYINLILQTAKIYETSSNKN